MSEQLAPKLEDFQKHDREDMDHESLSDISLDLDENHVSGEGEDESSFGDQDGEVSTPPKECYQFGRTIVSQITSTKKVKEEIKYFSKPGSFHDTHPHSGKYF